MSLNGMDDNRPECKLPDRREADNIRIMLATDCHIGVHERDPVRGQDSINTFKEVLQLAVKYDVDLILLAGDLFHENRPSRESLYQTIALLREYTLGNRPVSIELLSSPDDGKAVGYGFPAINYEDPNLNIGIPVFSIHGNHDDPQGAGGHEGALCALDILSVTGLVNYIGKIDLPVENEQQDASGIVVRPVLVKKGDTKLGMYGVGNVKDQRMHQQLRSNKVQMYTPKDKNDWFNILLLHQNRVKRGPVECVPEGMFDDSIDLVIWGHEHDCRIEPEPVAGKRYFISQPGSTVATSLAEGESITKHCALLEVQDKAFEITPIPLRTVRPFKMDTVCLSTVAEEEDINLNDRLSINSFLKRRITELIRDAKREFQERNADAELTVPPMLPLIRLRVDTTGVPEMTNPQRLGLEFQGRIANPRDVLTFIRPKTRNTKNAINEPELEIDQMDLGVQEKINKVRVGKLVQEYLGVQEMQLLGAEGMNDAIETYVEKEDTHAIATFVKGSLNDLRKEVPINGELDDNAIEDALTTAREAYEKEYRKERENTKEEKEKKKRAEKKAALDESAEVDSMLLDDDDDIASVATSAKSLPKRKATTRVAPPPKPNAKGKGKTATTTTTRGKGKKVPVADSDEEEDFEEAIMDIDSDNSEEEEAPKPKAKAKPKPKAAPTKSAPPKKTAATKGKKATQTSLSFAPSRSKATKKIDLSSEDSD